MKKTAGFFAAACMAALVFAGCSGGSENSGKTVDISEVAKAMTEATVFQDEVIALDAGVVPNYYTVPEGAEVVVYMCPTGATVEEISVFEAADGGVDAVKEEINRHIDARISEYEAYKPGEVQKLKGSKIVENGNYVAVIIADDTKPAADAFAKAFE